MAEPSVIKAPVESVRRRGFLPIETNTFDRVFISVILFVAINLLWMRFVEPHLALPNNLLIAVAISVALGVYIVRKG